ncbi:hypothetical protein E0H82_00825 [Acinetobacter sp. ANC 4910]|uniref:hypothetical protein n=1 Tax=Acinetobacter sp. ANC 4910 TaxID=2529850 RepID=UPI00103A5AF7|nr:hypothetical protein [Acinetobacter sp. ANC 4910]TCB38167.1 hypothetical protein E0H82_00825 [Acinetobacter sp. ANC 4910]
MRFLDYIDSDTSSYISLKEAISLLVEKTNWAINEVAIYLLNKEVPEELACLVRGSDYKIKISSGKHFSYGVFRPYGKDWAFEYLTNIAELSNGTTWETIAKYTAHWDYWNSAFICDSNLKLLENVYWYKEAFFDAYPIKSLNLLDDDQIPLNQNLTPIWDVQYLNILKDDMPNIKTIDPDFFSGANFDFEDSNTTSQIQSKETLSQNENNTKQLDNQLPLHIKILAMNDYFTVVESACFISFDEPEKMQTHIDSGNLAYNAWNYGEHMQAVKIIENGIRANKLDIENDGMIPRASLQRFLCERNHVISGFNDNQPLLILPRYGDPSIGYASPESYQKERSQLLKEFKQLKSELEQEKLQSSLLILDNQSSLSETNQLKARITELEAAQPKSIDSDVQLSPEQEIPNSRQRNNILKIISILSGMAGLPPEHFKAFNMMDVHAAQNNIDIPSKHTVADWLKKARDSN